MDYQVREHTANEIIVTVKRTEAEEPIQRDREGRYSVIAYNKSDANGGHYMHRPTFLVSETQRVPVETWGEGRNAQVFGACLRHDETGITIDVPPEGGVFDLRAGYWTVSSLTGTWTEWYDGHWIAGGIFASDPCGSHPVAGDTRSRGSRQGHQRACIDHRGYNHRAG